MEQSESRRSDIERWQECGRKLWPFVRYFGLFGGDAEAIEAVAELADLLGVDSDRRFDSSDMKIAAASAREEALGDIRTMVIASEEIQNGFGVSGRNALIDIIDRMLGRAK